MQTLDGRHKKIVIIAGPNGAGKTTFALERVAVRVSQGGHSVPENIIRRRYTSGIRNFHRVYRAVVDAWVVYDNSGKAPRLIEEGKNS